MPGAGVAVAVAVAGASGFFANSEPPKRPLPVDVGAGGAAELAAAGVVAGAASAGLGGRPKSPPPGVEEGAVAAVFVVVVLVACPIPGIRRSEHIPVFCNLPSEDIIERLRTKDQRILYLFTFRFV